jgi:hypothetical protein
MLVKVDIPEHHYMVCAFLNVILEADMATTQLTSDETAKLKSAFEKMDTAAAPKAAAVAASPREDFCKLWPQVKGVLQFLVGLPVIPQRVKDAINLVIKAGDTVSGVLC